ncbi:senescence marker protein-30 family protein, partial [Pseudomonas syringae pv. actinidiae ICMP 19096]
MNWLPVSEHRFKLAEGAFWDAEEQALYWVDIAGFLACRLVAGEYRQWRM